MNDLLSLVGLLLLTITFVVGAWCFLLFMIYLLAKLAQKLLDQ